VVSAEKNPQWKAYQRSQNGDGNRNNHTVLKRNDE